MDLEPDISRRLRDGAASVTARDDLGEVLAGAQRRRQRTRWLSVAGATAVVAIGVGGVVLVANRDRAPLVDRSSAAPTTVVAPAGAQPAAESVSPATDAPAVTDASGAAVGDDDATPVSTVLLPEFGADVAPDWDSDAALDYLDRTTEVYRRTMPSGFDLSVRLSDVSYGELFDVGWDAPTGSAELCLARPAAFIGGSDADRDAWTAQQWTDLPVDDSTTTQEVYLGTISSFVVVRTALPALEAVLSGGGMFEDRAEFVDGVAVLEVRYENEVSENEALREPTITVVTDADQGEAPETHEFPLYEYRLTQPSLPAECQPPDPPSMALPPPGEQPADPAAAEAEIRSRHALLVDRSVAPEDKPEGLLDDDTGVEEARLEMESGQYAESAVGAVYTIEEVVFTAPDTAWFRYSIDAPTGLFSNRFGQSTFNGDVWQITRQTICQDLSLAAGYCDGDGSPTPNLQPTDPWVVEASWNEWRQVVDLYWRSLQCNPVTPCGS